jgi:hypothetical protein
MNLEQPPKKVKYARIELLLPLLASKYEKTQVGIVNKLICLTSHLQSWRKMLREKKIFSQMEICARYEVGTYVIFLVLINNTTETSKVILSRRYIRHISSPSRLSSQVAF